MLSRPLSRPNPFFSVLDIIGTEDNKTLLPRPIEVVPQGYLGIVTHSSIYAYLHLKASVGDGCRPLQICNCKSGENILYNIVYIIVLKMFYIACIHVIMI